MAKTKFNEEDQLDQDVAIPAMEENFDFLFAPEVNVKTKAAKDIVPKLYVLGGSGSAIAHIKINELTSELLQVGNREHLLIVDNIKVVKKAIADGKLAPENQQKAIKFWITKGYPILDSVGEQTMVSKRLSLSDKKVLAKQLGKEVEELTADDFKTMVEPQVRGFKVAQTSGTAKQGECGHILIGTDKEAWVKLGGAVCDENVVYTVSDKAVEYTLEGSTRKLYPITFEKRETKIERTKK